MLEKLRKEENINCSTCIFYDLSKYECHYNPEPLKKDRSEWCGRYVNDRNMVYYASQLEIMQMQKLSMELPLPEEENDFQNDAAGTPAEDYGDEN